MFILHILLLTFMLVNSFHQLIRSMVKIIIKSINPNILVEVVVLMGFFYRTLFIFLYEMYIFNFKLLIVNILEFMNLISILINY
jgi:hypothetical protein